MSKKKKKDKAWKKLIAYKAWEKLIEQIRKYTAWKNRLNN